MGLSPQAEKNARIMLGALAGSTVLILIRSIFRTVELLDGWSGPLATNQVLFSVLDGMMVRLLPLHLPSPPLDLRPSSPPARH